MLKNCCTINKKQLTHFPINGVRVRSNQKKVVKLNRHSAQRDSNVQDSHLLARLPAPFVAMNEKGKQALQQLLQGLFDSCDDTLFELADRADHNAEQNMYFEAMREIRIKRRGMELAFSREIDSAFAQLLSGQNVPTVTDLDSSSSESLSLVANDELEELVAADNMILKAERQFAKHHKQLTRRFNTRVASDVVNEKTNPFGPAVICYAFIAACKTLEVEIKVKLVLFKLFDRYVMQHLEAVYEPCNEALASGGVLPDLDGQQGSQSGSQSSMQPAQAAQAVASETQANVFADLQNLLHNLPQAQATGILSGDAGGSGLAAPGHAPKIPQQQLLSLLQAMHQALAPKMQQQQMAALQGVNPQQIDIQNTLSQVLSNKLPEQAVSLGQVDDDSINLVSMLFQFILDDRNLATPMKALIARLQIPIIKVAMLDKSFFSKNGHPARKLLNEIAHASLGWVPTGQTDTDPLYQQVSKTVERVANDFSGNVELFEDALNEFVTFMEADQRRTGLVEQRTIRAEDGKAKSELARACVQTALNLCVEGQSLPKVVVRLLEDAWSNVLFLIYLKRGDDSPEWREALQVVEQLVWSVQSAGDDATFRDQLRAAIPDLVVKLREGMDGINVNHFEMNTMLEGLDQVHQQLLLPPQNTQPLADPDSLEAAGDDLDISLEQLDAELEDDLAELEAFGADADEAQTASAKIPDPANQIAAEANIERQVVEKIQLAGAAEVVESERVLAEDDPCMQQVSALQAGSWIELHQEEGKKFRCRLAAIIRGIDKYIFVNRAGMKVAEFSRQDLAKALKSQQVNLLDDGLLFDRALESVIGDLRNKKAGNL